MIKIAIPTQAILTKIHETSRDTSNSFENAQREEERIAEHMLQKQQKLNNFKKQVKQRVNAYVNIQKKVNEDQQLAVIKTIKSKNQVKIITSSDGKATFQRVLSNYHLNDAKKDLAAKSQQIKQSDDGEVPLPGGIWSEKREAEDKSQCKSQQRLCKSALSTSSSSIPDFVLRSLIDKNENNSSVSREYKRRIHSTRKIFADLEREKVKNELTKHTIENKSAVAKIKIEKEKQREKDEKFFEAHSKLQTLKDMFLTKPEQKTQIEVSSDEAQKQKNKEYIRYVEAIKELIRDKAQKKGFVIPPLCPCSNNFNPNNCANNCIFYKNPIEYVKALQSLLASNELIA